MKTIIEFLRTRRKLNVEREIAHINAHLDYWAKLDYTQYLIHCKVAELEARKASLEIELKHLNK